MKPETSGKYVPNLVRICSNYHFNNINNLSAYLVDICICGWTNTIYTSFIQRKYGTELAIRIEQQKPKKLVKSTTMNT